MDTDDLVYRLHKRAEIRRQIPGRKSVEEGKADRMADLLDEAGREIKRLRDLVNHERIAGFIATEDELLAIAQLSKKKDISAGAVMRQALRHYQMVCHRLDNGETMSFSGDEQRASEFRGDLL